MQNTTTNTTAQNNALQIISRHATLSEAVKAAGMDLSYNPQAAAQTIADIENGFRGNKGGEAFVTPEGVFYIFNCDIKLLNKYEPFISCLDDCAFSVVVIGEKEITFSEHKIAKTPGNRKAIARMGVIVGNR